jgi:hypothetical protein
MGDGGEPVTASVGNPPQERAIVKQLGVPAGGMSAIKWRRIR